MIQTIAFGEELRRFRERAFLLGRRAADSAVEWSADEHDERATHLVVRDEHDQLVGAIRVLLDRQWRIGDTEIDPATSVLIGRIAVVQREVHGRRVLVDLILQALLYALDSDRVTAYATPTLRMLAMYQRMGLPLKPVGQPFVSCGSDAQLVRSPVVEAIAVLEELVWSRPAPVGSTRTDLRCHP